MAACIDTVIASLEEQVVHKYVASRLLTLSSVQVQAMVDGNDTLALAAAGADDKFARSERRGAVSEPFLRNFSRTKMTNEERSVAA